MENLLQQVQSFSNLARPRLCWCSGSGCGQHPEQAELSEDTIPPKTPARGMRIYFQGCWAALSTQAWPLCTEHFPFARQAAPAMGRSVGSNSSPQGMDTQWPQKRDRKGKKNPEAPSSFPGGFSWTLWVLSFGSCGFFMSRLYLALRQLLVLRAPVSPEIPWMHWREAQVPTKGSTKSQESC